MVLIVAPYSNRNSATGERFGYGPQHQYHFSSTVCGMNGTHCCSGFPTLEDDYCSARDTQCVNGMCTACGRTGTPPCNGNDLCFLDDRPRYVNSVGLCDKCGFPGERCCPHEAFGGGCPEYFDYPSSVCLEGGNECGQACGNEGEDCCTGSLCFDGRSCQGNVCTPNPPDMVGRACGEPVTVRHTDEEGTYTIDMGRTSGDFWFKFNTYDVPDRLTIRSESQTLYALGCVGTLNIEPDPETGSLCTPFEIGKPRWCCDGPGSEGFCSAAMHFSGGSKIYVDVEKDCAGIGRTEWEFTVDCPY